MYNYVNIKIDFHARAILDIKRVFHNDKKVELLVGKILYNCLY